MWKKALEMYYEENTKRIYTHARTHVEAIKNMSEEFLFISQ